MKKTVTFGEIMGRICPPGYDRFRQTLPGKVVMTFAGAEANVATSIAHFGGNAQFVTALPENAIADTCIGTLKSFGVDTSKILRAPNGRLGLYFVERGANQRPSRVIYDREHSSLSLTPSSHYDWDGIFGGTHWFHISGITPAVSANAAECSLDAVKAAKNHGVTVSCDLNFRKTLWQWEQGTSPNKLAERVMREMLPYIDVVIANEGDASDVLNINAGDSNVEQGELELERYPEVAESIINEFPNVDKVAITLRESISASHNNWGAMLYIAESKTPYFAPLNASGIYQPYEIRQMVDRVGGGDSFAAALIFALQSEEHKHPARAVAFAVAASCLAHSIEGDFNINTKKEVEALLKGNASGRVIR